MRFLRQSTSVDLPIGPFLDSTDGITAETGLTITQPDVRLKKNAAAWGQKAAAQTLSHEEAGYYEVTLDGTDTDTLGLLRLAVAETGALPIWEEFMVMPAQVWDSLFGADVLQVDLAQWLGTAAATPTVAGVPEVDLTHVAGATTNVAALATNVDAILTDTGTTLQAEIDGVQADTEDIQARLPVALTSNGNMKSSLVEILTTALTETAGLLAGGFKKFFNIATPASTMDLIARVTLVDTVTTYTGNTPQTGDVFPLASTEIADIKAKTDNLPADPADASVVAGLIAALEAKVDIVDGVVDAILVDTAVIGTPAGVSVSADIAAIEAQTDDIGVAGAGLTAIPWNAAWDAEVQSEVTDALVAYDPPTQAEMVAEIDAVQTDVAAVKADTAAIKLKTDNLPSDPADASVVAGLIAGVEAKVDTVDTVVDAIKLKTDALPADPADASDIAASFATVNTKLDTIDDIVDAEVPAIKAKTDQLTFTTPNKVDVELAAADVSVAAANKIADHTLRRTYANARQSADGDAVNFRSLLGGIGKLVNRWNISGTALTVYQEDDATATAPGGVQTITGTPGADPITQIDTN